MLAEVGGIEDVRQSAQRRRFDVLPPLVPRTGTYMGGTMT